MVDYVTVKALHDLHRNRKLVLAKTSVVLLVTERQAGLSGSKDKDKSNDKSRGHLVQE
jgi:hypothetical protein